MTNCVKHIVNKCNCFSCTNVVEKKKQTNFEKITQSPETLAEWMEQPCSIDCPDCINITEEECKKRKLAWLKAEAEEEK